MPEVSGWPRGGETDRLGRGGIEERVVRARYVRARWLAPVSVGRFLLLLPLRSWPPLPWRLQPRRYTLRLCCSRCRATTTTHSRRTWVTSRRLCFARLLPTSSSSQSPPNRCKLKIRTATTATATTTTDAAHSC